MVVHGNAVHGNTSFAWLVEVEEKLDEGGLTRAVLPHQSDLLPGGDTKADVVEGVGLGTAITVFHTLHHDLAAPRHNTRGISLDLWLIIEKGTKVFNVQGVLMEGDQIGHQALEVARHGSY